jgi:hypothetical protein
MKKIIIVILLMFSIFSTSSLTYASSDIVGPEVIYKDKNKVLSLSQIKALYTSQNGAITVEEDLYTGNGDKSGIYTITFSDTVELKTIQVSVRTIGDIIAATQTNDVITIHVHKNQPLSQLGIIQVLENIQYITRTSQTEIYILSDTYKDNRDAPGNYVFEFHLADTSGFEDTYLVNIKVTNTDKLLPDILLDDPTPNFFESKFFNTMLLLACIGLALLIIMKTHKRFKIRKRG